MGYIVKICRRFFGWGIISLIYFLVSIGSSTSDMSLFMHYIYAAPLAYIIFLLIDILIKKMIDLKIISEFGTSDDFDGVSIPHIIITDIVADFFSPITIIWRAIAVWDYDDSNWADGRSARLFELAMIIISLAWCFFGLRSL